MAGGAAILLLITILLVVGGVALAVYGTGGLSGWGETDPDRDRGETPIEGHG